MRTEIARLQTSPFLFVYHVTRVSRFHVKHVRTRNGAQRRCSMIMIYHNVLPNVIRYTQTVNPNDDDDDYDDDDVGKRQRDSHKSL
ncbi:hypothetical protein M0804_005716 [Polistes exclamans]|nr:hypothetical protein M0804_005716 [Polistes exclamans]